MRLKGFAELCETAHAARAQGLDAGPQTLVDAEVIVEPVDPTDLAAGHGGHPTAHEVFLHDVERAPQVVAHVSLAAALKELLWLDRHFVPTLIAQLGGVVSEHGRLDFADLAGFEVVDRGGDVRGECEGTFKRFDHRLDGLVHVGDFRGLRHTAGDDEAVRAHEAVEPDVGREALAAVVAVDDVHGGEALAADLVEEVRLVGHFDAVHAGHRSAGTARHVSRENFPAVRLSRFDDRFGGQERVALRHRSVRCLCDDRGAVGTRFGQSERGDCEGFRFGLCVGFRRGLAERCGFIHRAIPKLLGRNVNKKFQLFFKDPFRNLERGICRVDSMTGIIMRSDVVVA